MQRVYLIVITVLMAINGLRLHVEQLNLCGRVDGIALCAPETVSEKGGPMATPPKEGH